MTEKYIVKTTASRLDLDESELRAAFASIHDDTPIWQAILQLALEELDEQIKHTAVLAGSPEHGPLAAAAGAMEAIGEFYNQLVKAYEAAHEIQPKAQ
jgi:hypothetical protein